MLAFFDHFYYYYQIYIKLKCEKNNIDVCLRIQLQLNTPAGPLT